MGEFFFGCFEKISIGFFIFYLICFFSACGLACFNFNDDENWKRWGSFKKGLRKESYYFSEGDMGVKFRVLEGFAFFCFLRGRESCREEVRFGRV